MARHRHSGFTLIELLIVVAIIGIIAAIALPALLRARQSGNEASAIGSMRAVASAQQAYSASAARGGYASQLPRLGLYCPGDIVPFLSHDLTNAVTVMKSGFNITMVTATGAPLGPPDCNGNPTVRGFYATAVTANPGISGNRAFAVATEGTIWQNVTSPGSVAPTEAEMNGPATAAVHPLR